MLFSLVNVQPHAHSVAQLPEYEGYFQPNAGYSVWAFITYHEDNSDPNSALVYGGVATGIGIDLS